MDFRISLAPSRRSAKVSAKWQHTIAKLIDIKTNGSALIQDSRARDRRYCPGESRGGKLARAAAISPWVEAGNRVSATSSVRAWVNDFIEECAAFPNGAHDGQVDAMTQALLQWNMVPQQAIFLDPSQAGRRASKATVTWSRQWS
jgi:predicted phage terminase large subunit-like protein